MKEGGPSGPQWLRWAQRLQAIAQEGLTFRDDRILLVRELDEAGWADVGESPSEAATRETLEESGYSVRPVRLLAAYDRDRHDHPSPTTSTNLPCGAPRFVQVVDSRFRGNDGSSKVGVRPYSVSTIVQADLGYQEKDLVPAD